MNWLQTKCSCCRSSTVTVKALVSLWLMSLLPLSLCMRTILWVSSYALVLPAAGFGKQPLHPPRDIRLLWEDDVAQSSILIKTQRGQEVPVGVALLKKCSHGSACCWEWDERFPFEWSWQRLGKVSPISMLPPHKGLRHVVPETISD